MSIVAHHRHDLIDLAILTEHNPGFGGFKIDRTSLRPCATKSLVEVVEFKQVPDQIRILARQLLTRCRFRRIQQRANLVVGQTCMRLDHCLEKLVAT